MQTKTKKSIFSTVVTLTILASLDQLGAFVFRVFLSRQIGDEGIGIYQVATSIIGVAAAIAASGLPLVLGKKIAEYRQINNQKGEKGAVTAALIIGIALSGILSALLLLCRGVLDVILQSTDASEAVLFMIPAIFALSIYAAFRGALWGQKHYFSHSLLEVIDQITRIVLGVAFLIGIHSAAAGAKLTAASFSATCVLTAIVSMIIFFRSGGKLGNPKGEIKSIFLQSIPVSGLRIAGSLFSSFIAVAFPLLLVAKLNFTAEQALSQYGILGGMTLPLIALPIIFVYAISTSLFPEISSNMKAGSLSKVRYHLQQAFNYTMVFGTLFIGCYTVFGDELGVIFFNSIQAGDYISRSGWIMLPLSVSLLTTNLLNSLELELKCLISYILGAAVLLFCMFFLTSSLGVYGIIVGCGAGMTVVALVNTIYICKKMQLTYKLLLNAAMLLVFSLLSAILAGLIYNLALTLFHVYFALALSVILCLMIFIVLCTLTNAANFNYFWKLLGKKLKVRQHKNNGQK